MNDREHFLFNLFLMMFALWLNEHYAFFIIDIHTLVILSASIIFSTLWLSPDLDINSKPLRRWGIFSVFWIVYKHFFHHRQASHGIITGFLSRMIYLGVIIGLAFFIIQKKYNIIFDFSYATNHLRLIGLLLLGTFLSNLGHILGDVVSDGLKKFGI